MPGDLDRLAPVFESDVEHLHQKFGQLDHPAGEALRLGGLGLAGEQLGVVVLQHPAAGTGGDDDGIVLGESLELLAGDLSGFVREAGIVGRLAAAGLRLRIHDLNPCASQQLDAGHPRLGITQIDQTGAEEIHLLGTDRHDLFYLCLGCGGLGRPARRG